MASSVVIAIIVGIILATKYTISVLSLQVSVPSDSYKAITHWCNILVHFRLFVLLLLASVLLSFVPLLALRMPEDNHDYLTHWHVYTWIVSFAYAKGTTMSYMILALWSLAIWIICLTMFRLAELSSRILKTDLLSSSSVNISSGKRCSSWVVMSTFFTANFILTVGVNALYVLSVAEDTLSQSATLMTQIGISLFRIASSLTLVPWFSSHVVKDGRRILFRIGLLLFNNLVVPCLVIAFTSSNCFQVRRCLSVQCGFVDFFDCMQGLLVEPDAVESTYTYPFCASYLYELNTSSTVCTTRTLSYQDTAPFVPSFVYNFQVL